MTEIETLEQKEKSEVEKLESFIKNGLVQISSHNYEEAIKHFKNPDFAKKIGVEWQHPIGIALTKELPDDEERIRRLFDRLAFSDGPHVAETSSGKIEMTFPSFDVLVPRGAKQPYVSPLFWHNASLVSAEEWLHVLQIKKGTNLTDELDHEADIAVYLHRKGVPLTNIFLETHPERKKAIEREIASK